MRQLLQNVTFITNCDSTAKLCSSDYHYTMAPYLFFQKKFERLPPSRFWFVFQYNWQEIYYLFPQLISEAKKPYLDEFTLSLFDDCYDCHRHWVLHSFYLWLVFSPCFFHFLFSHSQYLYRYFIPLLQCSKLYSQVVFHFSSDISNVQ